MSTRDSVHRADQSRRTALLNGDLDALELYLAPNYSMVHSSARAESRESMLEGLRGGGLIYQEIDVSESTVDELNPDVALQSSVVRQTVLVHGSPIKLHVRAVSIWIRCQGQWLLRFYQTTPVLVPPAK